MDQDSTKEKGRITLYDQAKYDLDPSYQAVELCIAEVPQVTRFVDVAATRHVFSPITAELFEHIICLCLVNLCSTRVQLCPLAPPKPVRIALTYTSSELKYADMRVLTERISADLRIRFFGGMRPTCVWRSMIEVCSLLGQPWDKNSLIGCLVTKRGRDVRGDLVMVEALCTREREPYWLRGLGWTDIYLLLSGSGPEEKRWVQATQLKNTIDAQEYAHAVAIRQKETSVSSIWGDTAPKHELVLGTLERALAIHQCLQLGRVPTVVREKKTYTCHVLLFCPGRPGREWRVLLQHRALQKWAVEARLSKEKLHENGQDVMGFPGGSASKLDCSPEMTAWREFLEEAEPEPKWKPERERGIGVGYSLTLSAFIASIESRLDYGSRGKKLYSYIYLVNFEKLVALGALPPSWSGNSRGGCIDTREISTALFPTGHVWAGESELLPAMSSPEKLEGHGARPIWSCALENLVDAREALGCSNPKGTTLYHGTSVESSVRILEQGFRLPPFGGDHPAPKCLGPSWKCVPVGASVPEKVCCCLGMMGRGVYLSDFSKACSNSGRASFYQGAGSQRGRVLMCSVDLGRCKINTDPAECSCGCRTPFVDHGGLWHKEEGYNSVKVLPGKPVKRAEWCVADPARVRVLAWRDVLFNGEREVVSMSEWTAV
jgi:hypothetical protein